MAIRDLMPTNLEETHRRIAEALDRNLRALQRNREALQRNGEAIRRNREAIEEMRVVIIAGFAGIMAQLRVAIDLLDDDDVVCRGRRLARRVDDPESRIQRLESSRVET